MSCTLFSHPDCVEHRPTPGHVERPERLSHLMAHLDRTGLLDDLERRDARLIDRHELARVHPESFIDAIFAASPSEGVVAIDPDTHMSAGSLDAVRRAAGAVTGAVEEVLAGSAKRAFCAIRPPGHHAEIASAMGFCLFNSVAVGAATALLDPAIERVAILDFDVHHGNGTADIFKDRPDVLVCSSFQHPFYPGRGMDLERPNIVDTPLQAGTAGHAFRLAIERDWLPALERHRPQLILVSAGFDAHREDPLGGLELTDDDYGWITALIVAAADEYAEGRIVSALEGGYDLDALARSVTVHVRGLAGTAGPV